MVIAASSLFLCIIDNQTPTTQGKRFILRVFKWVPAKEVERATRRATSLWRSRPPDKFPARPVQRVAKLMQEVDFGLTLEPGHVAAGEKQLPVPIPAARTCRRAARQTSKKLSILRDRERESVTPSHRHPFLGTILGMPAPECEGSR